MIFLRQAAFEPKSPVLVRILLTYFKSTQDPALIRRTPAEAAAIRAASNQGPTFQSHPLPALLDAGAASSVDPSSGATNSYDVPEVQAALITFLRRKDRTGHTLIEAVQALSERRAPEP